MKAFLLALTTLAACGTEHSDSQVAPTAAIMAPVAIEISQQSDQNSAPMDWYEVAKTEAEEWGLCVSTDNASEGFVLAYDCENVIDTINSWIVVKEEMRWKLESTTNLQTVIIDGVEEECAKSFRKFDYSREVGGTLSLSGDPVSQTVTGYNSQCKAITTVEIGY